jgi:hypothetical protein
VFLDAEAPCSPLGIATFARTHPRANSINALKRL